MHLRSFLWLRLIVVSWGNSVDMIRDYFLFKEVTTVAGFSCASYKNDYQVVKVLNDVGISVSLEQIGSNISVSQSLRADFWKTGVLMDLRCEFVDEDIVKIFDEASASYMFKHLHQWLILENSMNRTIQLLNDSTFSVITDFAISLPKNDDYVLYDIYNPCKHCGGSLSITELGIWTKGDGLNITLLENKFVRRRNLHQLKVKCGGLILGKLMDRDLIEYLLNHDSKLDTWSKFGYALMIHVAYMFNFTLDMIGLTELDVNESNGPLFLSLRERTVDIGYFPSILTMKRLEMADVILQVWPARTCFFFLTVPSTKFDMNIIFRPLEKNVWYMTGLLSIIIILTQWIILKVYGSSNWSQTIFIIIAAISQQGLPFESRQLSSRVAFLQTMLFGLLVYNCYSAAIVSSRLNNIPIDKMNDSLLSLARSKMKLAAHDTLTFRILLRQTTTAEIQSFQKYWDAIPDEKKFLPLNKGIERIMNPGFAYHADPTIAYPLIERMFSNEMISQLTEVHLQQPAQAGLFATKDGQFQEITKIGLIRTFTAGLRRREIIRWASRKPFYNKANQGASSVTITETIPIILVLLYGMAVSIVICIIENIVFRVFQTKRGAIQMSKHDKYYNSNVVMRNQRANQTWSDIKNIFLQYENRMLQTNH